MSKDRPANDKLYLRTCVRLLKPLPQDVYDKLLEEVRAAKHSYRMTVAHSHKTVSMLKFGE